mmetsp:Transcript_148773/g.386830  ORF Transcript_148773/g.386830 Transcript_148773/m.386830 type:complete len:291 (+) Transcript_148773:325-1197(+)
MTATSAADIMIWTPTRRDPITSCGWTTEGTSGSPFGSATGHPRAGAIGIAGGRAGTEAGTVAGRTAPATRTTTGVAAAAVGAASGTTAGSRGGTHPTVTGAPPTLQAGGAAGTRTAGGKTTQRRGSTPSRSGGPAAAAAAAAGARIPPPTRRLHLPTAGLPPTSHWSPRCCCSRLRSLSRLQLSTEEHHRQPRLYRWQLCRTSQMSRSASRPAALAGLAVAVAAALAGTSGGSRQDTPCGAARPPLALGCPPPGRRPLWPPRQRRLARSPSGRWTATAATAATGRTIGNA